MTVRGILLIAALCLAVSQVEARAQTGENILLVANALSQPSDEISEYYSRKRAVPGDQVLRLPMPLSEEIERADYETKIEQPIARWIVTHAAHDRILYIVLTKDVPLRIAGTGGQNGTVSSVDSELTLLYRKLAVGPGPAAGTIRNSFYLGDRPIATASRFTHKTYDIYLVGRLDGYTVDDVKQMIDRGSAPAHTGTIVLDGKLELGLAVGNRWLQNAAATVRKMSGWTDDRVVLDTGQTTLTNQTNVIGFYTWGSNAVAATARRFGHQFVPGAIAAEFVSTDARTFKEPPADWVMNDIKKPFGGSHQSLIGDFIRDGITGTAGHVAEPFLNGTVRPDLLFPAYAAGYNLIESFYMAIPSLSWQTVVIGDPLCTAFAPRPTPATTELQPALNPDTELPQYFSERRLAVLASLGAKPAAAQWFARAEIRDAKGDAQGSTEALIKATESDIFVPAELVLAARHERDEQWDEAIARYERIITKSPGHAMALNNLAYVLATRKNDTAAAFPLATKAYTLSVQDPTIGDTLAWIYHLMGNDAAAQPIISLAARRRPDSADIALHAAVISAATGNTASARQHLNTALRLMPTLETQTDVQSLREKLGDKK